MRTYLFSIVLIIGFLSCTSEKKLDAQSLRTGSFTTYLDDSDAVSKAVRNDSLQIETYDKAVDTFHITWKSNFEYILTKVNPKKGLDSVPFYVKITGIRGNSYTFRAYYKGSNFKQTGKAVKTKD